MKRGDSCANGKVSIKYICNLILAMAREYYYVKFKIKIKLAVYGPYPQCRFACLSDADARTEEPEKCEESSKLTGYCICRIIADCGFFLEYTVYE